MKESDLIFGLMAAFGQKKYSFQQLFRLVTLFDVTESCLRTNLSRMWKRGILGKDRIEKKIFYFFSASGAEFRSNVAQGFRTPDWYRWDESWIGVLFSVPDTKKQDRYQIRKELAEHRYAKLYSGFWIRPMNTDDETSEFIKRLNTDKYCRVIKFQNLTDMTDAKVRELWEIDEINELLEDGLRIIKMKLKLTDKLTPEKALIEKMETGDKIVKLLFADPLLPDRYLPENWKAKELREHFFKWDKLVTRISKSFWERVLK